MSTAHNTLQNFSQLMRNPDLYPDIDRVYAMFSIVFRLFGFVLGVAAVVIILVIVAKTVVDVAAVLFQGFAFSDSLKNHSSFRQSAEVPENLWVYVKRHTGSAVLGLALAGVLLSGYTLEIASKTMLLFGGAIDVMTNLDLDLSVSTEQLLRDDSLAKEIRQDLSAASAKIPGAKSRSEIEAKIILVGNTKYRNELMKEVNKVFGEPAPEPATEPTAPAE